MEEFTDDKGDVDWPALYKARVDRGEVCRRCECHIFSFRRDDEGRPRLCDDCKGLDSNEGEVSHDTLLRCPKCRETMDIQHMEQGDLSMDGDHNVSCDDCDHEFTIVTNVSWSFQSPELLKGGEG